MANTDVQALSEKVDLILNILQSQGILPATDEKTKKSSTKEKKKSSGGGYLTEQMDNLRQMLDELLNEERDADSIVKWFADKLRESYKNGLKKSKEKKTS